MSAEEELRQVVNELVVLLRNYVAALKDVDPASREGTRLADSVTKLLARVKDFENLLTEQESDIVLQLSRLKEKEKEKRMAQKVLEPNVQVAVEYLNAAIEYLRLAIHELGGK
jgi:hypothetical protein